MLVNIVAITSVSAENVTSATFGEPLQFPLTTAGSAPSKTQLTDSNDYYFTSKGKKITFLRKEGEYLLVRDNKKASPSVLTDNINQLFGGDVEVIKGHDFGSETVVKLNTQNDVSTTLSTLKDLDSSIEYVSPVLRNPQQKGDVGLMPRILVKLAPMIPPQKLLSEQGISANLTLKSTLKDAHQEYEYQINSAINDASDIFTLSRNIMNLPYVKWAEPVMLVAPQSHFTPNDTLYGNQWHLHNTGQNGGLIDADIDAPEGWELSKGDGAVIAIFDDGVQISHPDLTIWSNQGETGGGKETNGIDDDGNGYIDDYQGWDFGDADNDPSPSASTENHGTAVAGVAGAQGNNAQGVTGSAINAEILPVKSGFMSCTDWGNAMRYAGKYSDVVNNSWGISACQSALDSAISDVVNGNITDSKRGKKGTPILFATGNAASGWRRFSLSGFSPGSYTFRWEFSKDISNAEGYDTVWLDDISWPGGTSFNFESENLGVIPTGFSSSGSANWVTVNDGIHARGATGISVKSGTIANSQLTQLDITKAVGAGNLYFWVWVSSELNLDFFDFYVDGSQYFQYSPGQYSGHVNIVGYPASNPDTIAIGGSQDGGPGAVEERSDYSQFGTGLDVIAPTSGGFQGVYTTDRTGADGYDNASDYTTGFGGTSAATPLTSGIVADMLALKPDLSATQVRQVLRLGTDKIGPYTYPNNRRNDYYGYGRINLHSALLEANVLKPENMVKRNEIAKNILQYVHGSSYVPPVATGAAFSDIGPGDFQADWIEQFKLQGYTEGCSATKYCPEMFLTNEQAARILLKVVHGSAYTPPAASGTVFTDVSLYSFGADWIEQLSNEGITEGCNSTQFCPTMLMTWEGFDEMFFKITN